MRARLAAIATSIAIALLVLVAPAFPAADDPAADRAAALPAGSLALSLDGSDWLLATDPKDEGTLPPAAAAVWRRWPSPWGRRRWPPRTDRRPRSR